MPYITKERVREVREQLKKEFPKIKFSVTREHYSGIKIIIRSAPFNMLSNGRDYEQVNEFHIEENYKDAPEIGDILLRIKEIANTGNGELVYDGDYGSVPRFYIWINIGEFDRPFIKSNWWSFNTWNGV